MDNLTGTVVTGTVKSIAKFGAFITLPDGKTGLVHISEVANTYVDDVSRFLTQGQEVQVKVIAVDENGRLKLSIKQAQAPKRPPHTPHPTAQVKPPVDPFEQKLKAFLSESDSKIAGLRADHRTRSRKR